MSSSKMLQLIKKPETLKFSAYHAIKDLLVTGKLTRGTIYSANTFADMLGVSRTPIREALLELSAEGFLIAHDGKGFRVKELSEKTISDFFEMRRITELYVIERVTALLPESELAKLRNHLGVMQESYDRGKIEALLEADKAFHLSLIHYHQNSHLILVMNNIRDLMSFLGHDAIIKEGRSEAVLAEHRAIIGALEKRDTAAAIQAMRTHLESTENLLISDIRLLPRE